MSDLLDRQEYRRPLYSHREAAAIVGIAPGTLRNWTRGYVYKTLTGPSKTAEPLVTVADTGQGRVIPFVGLSEAYVLDAFRRTGVPMQRIRPAVKWLEEHMGLDAALTSERLLTDGAEILYAYDRDESAGGRPASHGELVVVRNQQVVFREVVQEHLQAIEYAEGRVKSIRLPRHPGVTVDPAINFGQPTFTSRGVRVLDVQNRLAAGEAVEDVADDYGLARSLVTDLVTITPAA